MKPFRVIAETGEMVILPPAFAHDIRNFEELSHAEFMKEVCKYPIKHGRQLMKYIYYVCQRTWLRTL